MLHRLALPPYSQLERYEGLGNYALWKYYNFPYSYFYQAKLKLMVNLMKEDGYRNAMDFGSGPGIFRNELLLHSGTVIKVDKWTKFDPRWRFDLIICGSVLEFVELMPTLHLLRSVLDYRGDIIIASPMETFFSRLYFKLIKDSNYRHSHKKIIESIRSVFKIEKIRYWNQLYFAVRAKIK